MRVASIDVGTNSVLLCAGEKLPDGQVRILLEDGKNSRLGEGLSQDNELQPEAMGRTIDAIGTFLKEARAVAAERFRIVGTSALREARNRDVFIDRVRNELGVVVEPISGDDEGRLSYLAISRDPVIGGFDGTQVIADVGGGSTEIIVGEGDRVVSSSSIKAGAVRFTGEYFNGNPPAACELVEAELATKHLLETLEKHPDTSRLVAVGGSAVNLARVHHGVTYEETSKVHGLRMSYRSLLELITSLAGLTSDERKQLTGLEPERADIILAGAIILERTLTWLGLQEMTISTRGLRHGVLYEMLGI